MITEEENIALNQMIASLDQYWAEIEALYVFVVSYSKSVPKTLSEQEQKILASCCRLIGFELLVRSMQKDRTIKCNVKHLGEKASFIEIEGNVYEVYTNKLRNNNTEVSANVFKLSNNSAIALLPTIDTTSAVAVDMNNVIENF